MSMRHSPQAGSTGRARQLRATMTPAELKLWSVLRGSQVGGFKFRRQAPIGPYIADFLCPARKLVIEADGGLHTVEGDAERTAFLEGQGYTVLRFRNFEILGQPEAVLRTVEAVLLRTLPPPAAPSGASRLPPQGEDRA